VALSVLIVDDDPDFRRLVRSLLSLSGFTVIGEAECVAAALLAAAKLQPDAALVDIGLPDGNGVDLGRALASLPWAPRVILTSSDPAMVEVCDGLDGYLPFLPKVDLASAQLLRLMGSAS
jgi:DNA-binding NarL/FixJ family response regulator